MCPDIRRESLTAFFQAAFRRNPTERFDNAEDMLRTWRQAFEGLEPPQLVADLEDEETLCERLAGVTPETQIAELELGTRASNVLDRENILTVEDLLSVPVRKLQRLRGVGNKTRREIATVVKILREDLDSPLIAEESLAATHEPVSATEPIEYGSLRIEQSISVVVSPLPLGEVGLSGPGEGSGGTDRPRTNDGQRPSPAAETATSPASGRGDRLSYIRHLLSGRS